MGSVLHSIECTCSTCWTEFLSWWRRAMGPHDERVVRHIFETSSSLCVKLFGRRRPEERREQEQLEDDQHQVEADLEDDAGEDARRRRRRLELRTFGPEIVLELMDGVLGEP